MKMRLYILALGLLLLCACDRQGVTELAGFITDDTVRLELDGERVFSYDEDGCQLAYNEKRCEFRAHTDTMLDYFVVNLSAVPARLGAKVSATIAWSTDTGEKTKENITLEAKRIKGDVIWLCDASRHNAVVLRVLE